MAGTSFDLFLRSFLNNDTHFIDEETGAQKTQVIFSSSHSNSVEHFEAKPGLLIVCFRALFVITPYSSLCLVYVEGF